MFGSGGHRTKKRVAGTGGVDPPLLPVVVSMRLTPIRRLNSCFLHQPELGNSSTRLPFPTLSCLGLGLWFSFTLPIPTACHQSLDHSPRLYSKTQEAWLSSKPWFSITLL